MMWLWGLLWSATAWAGGIHIVQEGDTIQSIAAAWGLSHQLDEVRRAAGLAEGQQPAVGTVIEMRDVQGSNTSCRPSYVRRVSGRGMVSRPATDAAPAGDELPLAAGVLLPEGSVVCTYKESFATLRLALGVDEEAWDDVVLMPNTCLQIKQVFVVERRRTSLLSLESGGVSVSTPVHSDGQVAVQTDAGVALGEGGFRIRREDEATVAEAIDRELVTIGRGVQVDLDVGFGNRTSDGAVPSEPIALLPPPTLSSPAADEVLYWPRFEWVGHERSVGYILTVARDKGFRDVVFRYGREGRDADGNRPRPPATIAEMSLPQSEQGLWWQVSDRDRRGLEGLPSEPRRLLLPSPKTVPE